MTLFLLDSTVHIQWARGHGSVANWLSQARRNGDQLATSSVAVAEVFSGARPSARAMWSEYFGHLDVLAVGERGAALAGQMRWDLRARGIQLQLADSLIGASALLVRATLVTANTRDFQHIGVPVLHLDGA